MYQLLTQLEDSLVVLVKIGTCLIPMAISFAIVKYDLLRPSSSSSSSSSSNSNE
jgi:hypothetical protein